MRENSMWCAAKGRRGSAIIGLVAVVVLVLIVIGVQKWLKANQPDPDVADLPPWKEWRLRENSQKPIPPLRQEQVRITKALEYDTNVELPGTGASAEPGAGQPRGEVRLMVSPEGQAWGQWSGSYYNSKKASCDIQAGGFEGKIYPGRIYKDANGKDETKVYFLAKGRFNFHEASGDNQQYHIRSGDIYVRGWIGEKLAADGEIIITSDEKYSETFRWKSLRPVGN